MLLKRTRFVAQVIGFACIGLLAFYGTAVAVSGRPVPWRAPSAATSAITPGYVSYQGTLRDDSDDPANGTYNMEVRICNNSGCTGDALWCEKHNGVTVREGQFNLLLGDGDGACAGSPAPPHGPISADIFTRPNRWVELKVGGTVMTPRQRLAAVPYAMSATYATTLSAPDGDPEDAVTVGNTGDVTVKEGNVTLETGNVRVVQGGVCIDSDGSCSPPGDAGLRANGDVYLANNSGAKVGVGKTNPQTELDVAGDASVSGNLGVGTTSPDAKLSVVGDVRGANEGAEDNYTEIGHDGSNGYINTVGDGALKFRHDGDNKMSLKDSGKLHVTGDVSWDGHLEDVGVHYPSSYEVESDAAGARYAWLHARANSVCFLETVKFQDIDDSGETAMCDIFIDDKGGTNYWRLKAFAENDSYAKCRAMCISW